MIPGAYLEYLIKFERQDQWSFYDLTGCPSELIVFLFQLADLGKQCEIASSMTWLRFDLTPIKAIEAQLRNWKNAEFATTDVFSETIGEQEGTSDNTIHEEVVQAQQDRHHCAEAWRYALLLYAERIFKWDRHGPQPNRLKVLARIVFNHVRCCRRTSQTQKQLLLPVFLAGSETQDHDLQGFVTDYCLWWGNKSRYNMFKSVPDLLKEVWARTSGQSSSEDERQWWGSVVDGKTSCQVQGQAQTQFLFG